MRGFDRLVPFCSEQPFPDRFAEMGIALLQKEPLTRNRFDDALGLQLGVGFGDRVAVDAQFLGQRPKGGQWLARAQSSGSRRVTNLIGQLQINRLAGLEIDQKYHLRLTVIYHYDSWRSVSRSQLWRGSFLQRSMVEGGH